MPHECFCELPESGVGFFRARIGGDAVDSGEDADDVAVKNGRGLMEGDTANRTSRVAANAR